MLYALLASEVIDVEALHAASKLKNSDRNKIFIIKFY